MQLLKILFFLVIYSHWFQQPLKRRYMVAGLAFFGFCVIYMLRVNLSVAIVAMTANKTIYLENGKNTTVRVNKLIS